MKRVMSLLLCISISYVIAAQPYIDRMPSYRSCLMFPHSCKITTTKNNFGSLHPCGVAISKQGKVAISTYEGDGAMGKVFIWESFNDFNRNKTANYQWEFINPEGIVFDNNEGLFIASTSTGQIHYLKDFDPNEFLISSAPKNISYYIDNNRNSPQNWNPRGMAVDAQNNLYVMCENLWPSPHVSKIVKVTNPTSASAVKTPLANSEQLGANALGITVYDTLLYTTDLKASTVNRYNLSVRGLIKRSTLYDAGTVLDITSDDTCVYFTNIVNDTSYVVKWNLKTGQTKNISMGSQRPGDNITTCWGVAVYGNYLVIADALHNQKRYVNIPGG